MNVYWRGLKRLPVSAGAFQQLEVEEGLREEEGM